VKFSSDAALYDFFADIDRGNFSVAASRIEGAVSSWRSEGIYNSLSKDSYLPDEFVAQICDCEIQCVERNSSVPSVFMVRWVQDVSIRDGVTYCNGGYNARIEVSDKLKIYYFIMDQSVDENRNASKMATLNG
jgi:hypothetical protein